MFYEEINKRTWNAAKQYLINLCKESSHWIFRGQSNPDWEVTSTIERELRYSDQENSSIENKLISEFKRAAPNYLNQNQIPAKLVEWMALMQHYGAPTRLVDFTKSPYIATFFAFENIFENYKYVTVWAVESYKLKQLANEVYIDDDVPQLMKNNKYLVYPIEPFIMNERFEKQQGTFLITGNINQSLATNFIEMGLLEDMGIIKKINIPKIEKNSVIQDLNLMNINPVTLFPGLDGYSRYIKKMTDAIYKKDFTYFKRGN